MYKDIVDQNFEWENFTIEEQNEILASGRSNNYLDTSTLETLYPNVMHIKDAVRKCLVEYK
jgi:3,5-epimerase/4-reductase